jgi:hypothetical protein
MPQALVLTAIVISFATTALFLVVLLASRGLTTRQRSTWTAGEGRKRAMRRAVRGPSPRAGIACDAACRNSSSCRSCFRSPRAFMLLFENRAGMEGDRRTSPRRSPACSWRCAAELDEPHEGIAAIGVHLPGTGTCRSASCSSPTAAALMLVLTGIVARLGAVLAARWRAQRCALSTRCSRSS